MSEETAGQKVTYNPALNYDSLANAYLSSGLVGMQLYVRNKEGRWHGSYGFSRLESKRVLEENDLMRTASMTKAFTYALVKRLEKEGLLHSGQKIHELLPDSVIGRFPNYREVTINDLLLHISGLPDFTNQDFAATVLREVPLQEEYLDPLRLIGFAETPDNAQDRTLPVWSYSNTGYFLLGLIIEKAGGMKYHAVLRKYLLEPLKMEYSMLEGREGRPGSIADSYTVFDPNMVRLGMFKNAPVVRGDGLANLSAGQQYGFNSWAWSAGALASNATDLAKFADAFLAGQIELDQRIFMPSPQDPGLMHVRGGSWGIDASMLINRQEKIVVIAISNTTNVPGFSSSFPAWQLSREIYDKLLD